MIWTNWVSRLRIFSMRWFIVAVARVEPQHGKAKTMYLQILKIIERGIERGTSHWHLLCCLFDIYDPPKSSIYFWLSMSTHLQILEIIERGIERGTSHWHLLCCLFDIYDPPKSPIYFWLSMSTHLQWRRYLSVDGDKGLSFPATEGRSQSWRLWGWPALKWSSGPNRFQWLKYQPFISTP